MMPFSPAVDIVELVCRYVSICMKISLKHSIYDFVLHIITRNGSQGKTIGSAEASFSSKGNNIGGLY